MKNIILIIAILIISTSLQAHNPNETHAVIFIKNNQMHIEADLPWTISKPIKKAYSNLEKSEVAIENAIKNYVQRHLKISKNGQNITATSIDIFSGAHAHSTKMKLTFPINDFKGIHIQNTILFASSRKQQNYHKVIWNDQSQHFITKKGQPSFEISSVSPKPTKANLALPFLVVFSLIGTFFLFRKTFRVQ
jgi:hypothetical protein